MARPKLRIDKQLIYKLAKIQCTQEEIAEVVGCSVDTLHRRFAGTIKRAKEYGRSSLRRRQYHSAMRGNVTMMIWLGKQYLGQKDRQDMTTGDREIEFTVRVNGTDIQPPLARAVSGKRDIQH